MSLELFPHNKIAYENLERMLLEQNKAAVIHPTGTGKSYIVFALIEAHPDKQFIWISPNEYIIQVQRENLKNDYGIEFKNVKYYTYSWLIYNQMMLPMLYGDYLILDEFHRAGAPHWEQAVRKLMDIHKNMKIIGLSATNIRFLDHERNMAEELFEGCIASEMTLSEAMAKKILPVPVYVASIYSYKKKVERLEKRVQAIQNEKIRLRNQYTLDRLKHEIELAGGITEIFTKYMKKRNSRYIVFCTNKEHMEELITNVPKWFAKIDKFPHVYQVYSDYYHAKSEFAKFHEDDSDHIKLLFVIDMLNEGIHIDKVDGVILMRPTLSPIVYKQQIGRALAAGKTKHPIIFDFVNNFEKISEIEELKNEYDSLVNQYCFGNGDYSFDEFFIFDELKNFNEILKKLQGEMYPSWDEYYQELLVYRKQYGDVLVPRRYITEQGISLGRWLLQQRHEYWHGRLPADKEKLLRDAGVIMNRYADENFLEWYDLLIQYKKIKGDLLISKDYLTKDNHNLGVWCINIRMQKKKGELSQEREKMLDEIGFIWDVHEYSWEIGLQHAQEFYQRHGDLKVPKKYRCEDGFELGFWIMTQKRVYQKKAPGNLTEQKMKRLEMIGMDWSQNIIYSYEQRLDALKEFHQKYPDELIRDDYVTPEGMPLGSWVCMQRNLYNKGELSERQIQELEELGVVWNRNDYNWMQLYKRAKAYYKKHGTVFIPQNEKGNDVPLYHWIIRARRQYLMENHDNLEEWKVKLLEEINIKYSRQHECCWKQGVDALRNYQNEFGTTLVPNDYKNEDGYGLGKWISRAKKNYRDNKLTEEQIAELNQLGMIWEGNQEYLNRTYSEMMYESAKNYYKEHGNLQVPASGGKLGSWLCCLRAIRKGKRKGNLSDDLIQRLDEIGMKW